MIRLVVRIIANFLNGLAAMPLMPLKIPFMRNEHGWWWRWIFPQPPVCWGRDGRWVHYISPSNGCTWFAGVTFAGEERGAAHASFKWLAFFKALANK